jgi:septal ring factor EnvC (AmiA/AmiB activator)
MKNACMRSCARGTARPTRSILALPALIVLAFVASDASGQTADTSESLAGQIAQKERSIAEAIAQRHRVAAEIDALVGQRGAAQRRMKTRVRGLYRMRRAGALPLAGGFEALIRHQSRIERLERMVGRDVTSLRTLSRRIAALQLEDGRLSGELESGERELASLRQRKAQLDQAAAGMWASVMPRAEPPAVLPGSEAPWSGGFGMRVVDAAPQARFETLRGSLPMPISGSARIGDAQREGGEGVELSGNAGASVRAVAAGIVSYAAPHPSYGNLVIVDHGGSYYTVYGSLGTIGVRVGQPLAASTTVGSLGPQATFFQVRRGTRPLSAREWLGL